MRLTAAFSTGWASALATVSSLGRASFPVAAVLSHEPDRLAAGPAFGARILLSLDALKKTGLVEPGSLVRWSYRIKARAPLPASFKEDLASKFPEAGFLTRDSSDPSPGVKNMLQRLTEFLTLTGLTAMLTGGIGVANAVGGFIERRRKTIAIYKSLGASQAIVFRVFLIEIGLLALIGIAIGFALAAAVPWASAGLMRDVVPIDIETGLQGRALGLAALFGLLTALPFILWPIGRAGQVRAAELFRDSSGERPGLPPLGYRLASFLAAGLLAAAAIALSQEHRIAAVTCAAILGVFGLFWVAGIAIRRAALAIKRPKRPELALALANIGGPASLSRTIALSLGAGLTLLTAVSLVDASLTHEIQSRLPEHAPSYFFVGVPKQDLQAFEELLSRNAPAAKITTAPMLRGRIVALKGVPVEQLKVPSSAEWVLNGDRGITYSDTLPAGSQTTEGQWWAPDYEGEPLVSFEADSAKALGLAIGDTIAVNVIGRNLTARIANLRKVQWGSMDINFVMIFSKNALKKAPFNFLAALSWPEGQAPDLKAEIGDPESNRRRLSHRVRDQRQGCAGRHQRRVRKSDAGGPDRGQRDAYHGRPGGGGRAHGGAAAAHLRGRRFAHAGRGQAPDRHGPSAGVSGPRAMPLGNRGRARPGRRLFGGYAGHEAKLQPVGYLAIAAFGA